MTEKKDVQRMNVNIDSATRTITVQVPNEQNVVLHLDRLSDDNKRYAALYGIGVRITRAAALPSGSSWSDKRAAMQALIEHLESGSPDWSPARQSGGRIGSDELMLARALQELYPNKSAERIREYLGGMTKAQRTAVSNTAQVKEIMDRLRAEATQDINGEDLLADL